VQQVLELELVVVLPQAQVLQQVQVLLEQLALQLAA
jgi:hypothetical protein